MRQWIFVSVHREDHVDQQALLFIRLRDGDLAQVHPIGVGAIMEHIIGADGTRTAVAVNIHPRRVALAGVHDRLRKIIGKCRSLSAVQADVDRGHCRVRGGSRCIGIQGRNRCCAIERVKVSRAVILHGLVDDALSRRRCGVDKQVAFAERSPGGGQAEQARQLRVRSHGDQVAAVVDPVRDQAHFGGGQRHFTEDDPLMAVEQCGGQVGDIGGCEFVQALGAQNFSIVPAERIGGARKHEDRSTRTFVGRRS